MTQDKPDEKSAGGSGLTFPQIAAGALAAATAAILGSFLGVFGTIGGAAAASIVSTVGSSLYQKSLERTRDKVKERLVVAGEANTKVGTAVARITGQPAPPSSSGTRQPSGAQRPGVPAPGARQQQPAPPAPPGTYGRPGAMPPGPIRPGQQPPGTVAGRGPGGEPVLRAGGRTVVTRVDPSAPPRPTGGIPTARITGTPPSGMGPFRPGPGSPGGPPPTAYMGVPDGSDDATQLTPQTAAGTAERKPIRWKRWVVLAGFAASIFAIGIVASLFTETAVGHPLSGGSSGTSVGSIFGQNTGSSTPTTSTAPSDQDTSGSETATSTPTETGSNSSDSGQSSQRQQSGQSGSGSSGGQTTSRAPTTSQNSSGGGSGNSLGGLLNPNG